MASLIEGLLRRSVCCHKPTKDSIPVASPSSASELQKEMDRGSMHLPHADSAHVREGRCHGDRSWIVQGGQWWSRATEVCAWMLTPFFHTEMPPSPYPCKITGVRPRRPISKQVTYWEANKKCFFYLFQTVRFTPPTITACSTYSINTAV